MPTAYGVTSCGKASALAMAAATMTSLTAESSFSASQPPPRPPARPPPCPPLMAPPPPPPPASAQAQLISQTPPRPMIPPAPYVASAPLMEPVLEQGLGKSPGLGKGGKSKKGKGFANVNGSTDWPFEVPEQAKPAFQDSGFQPWAGKDGCDGSFKGGKAKSAKSGKGKWKASKGPQSAKGGWANAGQAWSPSGAVGGGDAIVGEHSQWMVDTSAGVQDGGTIGVPGWQGGETVHANNVLSHTGATHAARPPAPLAGDAAVLPGWILEGADQGLTSVMHESASPTTFSQPSPEVWTGNSLSAMDSSMAAGAMNGPFGGLAPTPFLHMEAQFPVYATAPGGLPVMQECTSSTDTYGVAPQPAADGISMDQWEAHVQQPLGLQPLATIGSMPDLRTDPGARQGITSQMWDSASGKLVDTDLPEEIMEMMKVSRP